MHVVVIKYVTVYSNTIYSCICCMWFVSLNIEFSVIYKVYKSNFKVCDSQAFQKRVFLCVWLLI